jgi:hypothetical protein
MQRTEYTWMSDDELIQFAESRNSDALVVELSQRLDNALEHLRSFEQTSPT